MSIILLKKLQDDKKKKQFLEKFKKQNTSAIKTLLINDRIYLEFNDDIYLIKNLKNQLFKLTLDKKNGWYCPLCVQNIEILKELNIEIDKKISIWEKRLLSSKTKKKFEIKGIRIKPKSFQYEGISFIESKQGRALIADEMGLGKTIQSLAWLQYSRQFPAIIIMPASLKYNWYEEVKNVLFNPRIFICEGKTPSKIDKNATIILINYDIIFYWRSVLKKIKPLTVICDEIQKLANENTNRSKGVQDVSKNSKNFIGLSGTPVKNKPINFYNIFRLIQPKLFPSITLYKNKYCNPKFNGFAWDYSGASNLDDLHEKTKYVMIRRLKEDVIDLPPKQKTVIPVQINLTEYQKKFNEYKKWLESKYETKDGEIKKMKDNPARAMVELEKTKIAIAAAKIPFVIEWLKNVIEEQKIIVFCIHKEIIEILNKQFPKNIKIVGGISSAKKQQLINKFQNNENCRICLANIESGGVGHTLTAATNVVFLEYPWTADLIDQAIDRAHRIGQIKPVNIWFFVGKNTIEEKIIDFLDKQREVVNQIMTGKQLDNDEKIFNKFLKSL